MNPYKALHDVLEALPVKRLGVGFLCSCAMGKILPEELRKYTSTTYRPGTVPFWRVPGFDSVLTPLGFTPHHRLRDREGERQPRSVLGGAR